MPATQLTTDYRHLTTATYSPSLGRFTQPDTIIPDLTNTQSWNRFSYVGNNPINFNDPTGHKEVGACDPYDQDCWEAQNPPAPPPNDDSGDGDGGGGGKGGEEEKQTDVTEWLSNELNIQRDNIEENNICRYAAPEYMLFCLLGVHFNQFGNGGRYDIKLGMENEIGREVVLCGNDGCAWLDYSAPGNIMYGYLSGARGIPQDISHFAGNVAESADNHRLMLDNPGDKAAVDFGYSLYQKYPDGFSLEQFQAELTRGVLQSFQPPDIFPSEQPLPQENTYPPGFFLND